MTTNINNIDSIENNSTINFTEEDFADIDNINNSNNENDEINGEFYQDILNIYLQYYKKTYPDKNIHTLFHNIDAHDPISTNHPLELFFEEMLKYKKIDKKLHTTFDDIKNQDVIYGLQIDGEIKCVAISVITLIIEIIDKYKKNVWNIICLS